MLVIVRLSRQALHHRPSMEALAKFAIEHELAVVCSPGAQSEFIGAMRHTLPWQRVVALLGDEDLPRQEVGLIRELLSEGRLPVLLTAEEPDEIELRYRLNELADWLDADVSLTLPIGTTSVN